MSTPRVPIVTAALALLLAGCDSAPVQPDARPLDAVGAQADRTAPARRKKPPKDEPEPEPEPEPTPDYVWYQLAVPDDPDPLWRFGLDGNRVLLRTDPTVTLWGEDYWGYWSDPFTLVDGSVTYTTGLVQTSYTFSPASDGFDVAKTVLKFPYLGGGTTTTHTRVGIFRPAG